MKLSSYLSEDIIVPKLKGENFEELVSNLIDEVAKHNKKVRNQKDKLKKAVLKREEEASTYLGYGIAIPHTRIEAFDDIIVAIGFLEKPLMMTSLGSNQPEEAKMFILVLADVLKNKNILKIMSGISRLAMKNYKVLEEILKHKSPSKTIKILDDMKIEIDHNIIADDLFSSVPAPARVTNTLEDIAKRIIMEKVSGIPVVDEKENFLGEITERELIAFGMPKHTTLVDDLSFLTVGEPFENYLINEKVTTIEELYRKEDIVTVDKEASLMEISYLFMNRGVTRIYVVENGKYMGVISRSDIIKKILHI